MTRLPTHWKSLACLMIAATMAPAASEADDLPVPIYGIDQTNPQRPPIVSIANAQGTITKQFTCPYRGNVGNCLESASVTGAMDDNTLCAFKSGRARTGSYLGPYASSNLVYDYYDLYVDGDILLDAQEM